MATAPGLATPAGPSLGTPALPDAAAAGPSPADGSRAAFAMAGEAAARGAAGDGAARAAPGAGTVADAGAYACACGG